MKPYFTTPITTVEESHEFFNKLWGDGLMFHPEDNLSTILNPLGEKLFSKAEVRVLKKRIKEVYAVDSDPCAFILDHLVIL